jgi:hypothetical protein
VPSLQRSAAFKIAYSAITGLTLYDCITIYFPSRGCYIFINPILGPSERLSVGRLGHSSYTLSLAYRYRKSASRLSQPTHLWLFTTCTSSTDFSANHTLPSIAAELWQRPEPSGNYSIVLLYSSRICASALRHSHVRRSDDIRCFARVSYQSRAAVSLASDAGPG